MRKLGKLWRYTNFTYPLFIGTPPGRIPYLLPFVVYSINMDILIPDIESDIPLPAKAVDALPELSPAEELAMRVRTIKLISDIVGAPLDPTDEQREEATDLAKQMMQNPKMRPEYSKYPNETMAYLAGLVAQSNCMIVEELSDLKLYVINKLVQEVEHATSSKDRISALAKLGEVDGVDAFKKRSEVTMQVKSIAEVEKELLETLNVLETKFVEVKPAEIVQNDG